MDTKDLSKVQKDRNVKLEKLRSEGFDYPNDFEKKYDCLLYTSPSPRDGLLSRMPSSA